DADGVRLQGARLVLESGQERRLGGDVHPARVVIRGVPVPDRRVEPPDREPEPAARLVVQHHALDVEAETLFALVDDLREHGEGARQAAVDHGVDLAEGERVGSGGIAELLAVVDVAAEVPFERLGHIIRLHRAGDGREEQSSEQEPERQGLPLSGSGSFFFRSAPGGDQIFYLWGKGRALSHLRWRGRAARCNSGAAMKIHEYQAKELLRGYGVAVPRGKLALSPEEAVAAARELMVGGTSGAVVVKAQIHAGGRGKGGGVKLARSPEGAGGAFKKMMGTELVTRQ